MYRQWRKPEQTTFHVNAGFDDDDVLMSVGTVEPLLFQSNRDGYVSSSYHGMKIKLPALSEFTRELWELLCSDDDTNKTRHFRFNVLQ